MMTSFLPGDLVVIKHPNTSPSYWTSLKDVRNQSFKSVVDYHDIRTGDVGMVVEGPEDIRGYDVYLISVKGHFVAIEIPRIVKYRK